MMITLHDLISATPMYRSLTAATQARYMRRAGKRIHRHFRRAGVVDGVIDSVISSDFTDDFATQFVVKPDNARTVVRLICTVWSFSWLGMIFSTFWAAYKKAAPIVLIEYLLTVGLMCLLFISLEAHAMWLDLILIPSLVSITVLTALFGRSLAIHNEASEIVLSRLDVEVRWTVDRIAVLILGPRHPWLRVLLCLGVLISITAVEVFIGRALYGDLYMGFISIDFKNAPTPTNFILP